MKNVTTVLEQKFYSAIRWCLRHQTPTLLIVLLAVIIPITTLSVIEYRSMVQYEADSTAATQAQLQYILSRLVLEVHDDTLNGGLIIFHRNDSEHSELLKQQPSKIQILVNQLQNTRISESKKFKRSNKTYRSVVEQLFIITPTPARNWRIFLPNKMVVVHARDIIQHAQNYFTHLLPQQKDVGYLFFYDQASESLVLLHAISGEVPSFDTITAPRSIKAIIGMIIPKGSFEPKFFKSKIRHTENNRFDTSPVDNTLSQANYYFQVTDEKGKILFTDRKDWNKLAQNPTYIKSQLTLLPEQKFLTGWTFAVIQKSPFSQITNINIWQMGWASILVALTLGLLLFIILRAGLVAVKISDMKSDIVAGVSHDLKTPLAGIMASAQLLASGRVKGEAETKEFSGYIMSEAQRLTEVIEKVLTLAKLESSQLKMYPTKFSVQDLVNQAIKSISCAFPDTIILKGGIPDSEVFGDFQALNTVLVNLMENAIRYSREQPWIKVQAFWSQQGDKRTLHLQVEDHGVGIAPEEQTFIFEKFYRVRKGLITDTDGTGLGLAIASQIVRAHNGFIQVESEVGVGSKFTVRLPDEWNYSRR